MSWRLSIDRNRYSEEFLVNLSGLEPTAQRRVLNYHFHSYAYGFLFLLCLLSFPYLNVTRIDRFYEKIKTYFVFYSDQKYLKY